MENSASDLMLNENNTKSSRRKSVSRNGSKRRSRGRSATTKIGKDEPDFRWDKLKLDDSDEVARFGESMGSIGSDYRWDLLKIGDDNEDEKETSRFSESVLSTGSIGTFYTARSSDENRFGDSLGSLGSLDNPAANLRMDESERLRAEVAKDLDESRRRQERNQKKREKRERSLQRRQELEEALAANKAVEMGRELLANHSDQRAEDQHRSLLNEVKKEQAADFFDLSSFLNAPTTSAADAAGGDESKSSITSVDIASPNGKVARLEDRLEKHKAKVAQQKEAYARFQAEHERKDREAANKDLTDSEAKAAFQALKAKKAQRKSRSKSPKRSPRGAGAPLRRNVTYTEQSGSEKPASSRGGGPLRRNMTYNATSA